MRRLSSNWQLKVLEDFICSGNAPSSPSAKPAFAQAVPSAGLSLCLGAAWELGALAVTGKLAGLGARGRGTAAEPGETPNPCPPPPPPPAPPYCWPLSYEYLRAHGLLLAARMTPRSNFGSPPSSACARKAMKLAGAPTPAPLYSAWDLQGTILLFQLS